MLALVGSFHDVAFYGREDKSEIIENGSLKSSVHKRKAIRKCRSCEIAYFRSLWRIPSDFMPSEGGTCIKNNLYRELRERYGNRKDGGRNKSGFPLATEWNASLEIFLKVSQASKSRLQHGLPEVGIMHVAGFIEATLFQLTSSAAPFMS
jgi:hypothetical protein